jgi:DsbC/DsbD-like thiol-disulfide interchange protein
MSMRPALLALPLVAAAAPGSAADPERYMTAELIAGSSTPAPGSTVLIGIRMSPRPGWHGYWSNPGDSGIAPTVRWSAPDGVRFGPLLHPAPVLLTADGISSFAHKGRHVLLSRMTIPSSLASGTPIPISARLSWAACTATQCVPLNATLDLQLAAGDGSKGKDWPEIEAAVRSLPRPAPDGGFTFRGETLRLSVPAGLKLDPASTRFFPDEAGAFDTAGARAARRGEVLTISAPSSGGASSPISGVLADGRVSYRLRFVRRDDSPRPEQLTAAAAGDAPQTIPSPAPPREPSALAQKPPSSTTPVGSPTPGGWAAAGFAALAGAGLLLSRRRR